MEREKGMNTEFVVGKPFGKLPSWKTEKWIRR
jgi:hypothetical protein